MMDATAQSVGVIASNRPESALDYVKGMPKRMANHTRLIFWILGVILTFVVIVVWRIELVELIRPRWRTLLWLAPPLLFWIWIWRVFKSGQVIDFDREQNEEIVRRKELGLMDAAELADSQISGHPLASIDVFVPLPLEISNKKVLRSTVSWVNQQLANQGVGESPQIRFWTPKSHNAEHSSRAVQMILENLENRSGVENVIKLVSAPDYIFMCDMTLHTRSGAIIPNCAVGDSRGGIPCRLKV
jgi:hypothetical protein